jgi:DNA polymerase-3 subunit delta
LGGGFIKTDAPRRYYVLAGDGEFFRNEFIKELFETFLKGRVDDSSIETFDISDKTQETDAAQIIEAVNTAPFFSEKKFVLVKNFTKFKKDEMYRLCEFLPRIPEFTTMVLTTVDDAKDVISAGIPSENILNLAASPAADITNWSAGYLKNIGKEIDPELLEYITAESGAEPAIVKNELDKMILISGDKKEITMDDFSRTRGVDRGYGLDELTEAIVLRDEAKTFEILGKILPDTAPEQLMGFIFYRIKSLYIMRFFLSAGEFKKLFRFVYIKDIEKAKAQAKSFARAPYTDILSIINDADRAIKHSSRDRAGAVITAMLSRIFLRLENK